MQRQRMKLRPTKTFLGCCSLVVGVEVFCAAALFVQVVVIAACSSAEPLRFAGVVVSPEVQVLAASWAFIGIPISISGGTGALYRVEPNVRLLLAYASASFVAGLVIPFWFLHSSSVCDLVVAPELQNQGSAFVCGFAETFVFAWSLMSGFSHAYMIYIIWSAAEDMRLFPNPELMRYEEALKSVSFPAVEEPTGPTPEMFAKAAFPASSPYMPPGGAGGKTTARSAAGVAAPGPVSAVAWAEAEAGTPQSFFPAPRRGAVFA